MKKQEVDKAVLEGIFREMNALRIEACANKELLEKNFERYDAMLKVVEMLGYKKECVAWMNENEEI